MKQKILLYSTAVIAVSVSASFMIFQPHSPHKIADLINPFARSPASDSMLSPGEMRALWKDVKSNFEHNPYFTKAGYNQARDGVPSPFAVDAHDKILKDIQTNPQSSYRPAHAETYLHQSDPLSPDLLNLMQDFEFLDYAIFAMAVNGMKAIRSYLDPEISNDIITIVDHDRHLTQRRLFVISLSQKRVLFNLHMGSSGVSLNQIRQVDTKFGNESGSSLSSLGFFSTAENAHTSTAYGFPALKIKGLDATINDLVQFDGGRNIIFHAMGRLDQKSVCENTTSKGKMINLSYSEGCFTLSDMESGKFYGLADRPVVELVINQIKGNSVVFAYASETDPTTGEQIEPRVPHRSIRQSAFIQVVPFDVEP